MTWFEIRYHFWQDVCDQICEKRPLLKHLKNGLYTHSWYVCTVTLMVMCGVCNCMYTNCFWDVLTVVPFHKSGHKCFARSVILLQIRSHVFTEVVNICVLQSHLLSKLCLIVSLAIYCLGKHIAKSVILLQIRSHVFTEVVNICVLQSHLLSKLYLIVFLAIYCLGKHILYFIKPNY